MTREDIDLSKVEYVEIDGIDFGDYPDFCDAYVSAAEYEGRPMTDDELDFINTQCGDFVYECLMKKIF